MFRKPKKIVVNFEYDHKGSGGSSTTEPLDSEELLQHLKWLCDRHGDLSIKGFKNDNVLKVTTTETQNREHIDDKLYGINKTIKNYINDNALATGTEVAAVFAEGELKGLYAQEVMSRFKTMYLERDGYKPEEIEIKTLKIDKL